MLISITRGTLFASLKALSAFSSTDPTRFHLTSIYFEATPAGELTLVATDGHTMAVATPTVRVETPHPAGASVIMRSEDAARLAAAVKPIKAAADERVTLLFVGRTVKLTSELSYGAVPAMEFTGVDSQFPTWRAVVPAKAESAGVPLFGIDARYLARAGKAFEAFATSDRGRGVGVEFNTVVSELDPIRMDIESSSHGALTIVIMPRRIAAVDARIASDARTEIRRASRALRPV
jgi:hypothetical protein